MRFFSSLWEVSTAFADQVTVSSTPPVQATGDLTDLIHQVYNAAMMFGGLLAFLMILYAGAKYVFEPGSSSAQGDAKDQIWQAFLGLLLLFGIYIILNTINPDLTRLSVPTLKKIQVPAEMPVSVITCGGCPNGKTCNARTSACEWITAQGSTCNPNIEGGCAQTETCSIVGNRRDGPLWGCRTTEETRTAACGTCRTGTRCMDVFGEASCLEFTPGSCGNSCDESRGNICVRTGTVFLCGLPAR